MDSWSKEEIEKLRELYPKTSLNKLAKIFNRTKSSIFHKAQRLGLSSSVWWSEEEIKLLKKLYPTSSNIKVAKILGRSPIAISIKAHKLRLRKHPAYWRGEIRKVRGMHPTERSWLACAIDGEGSISLHGEKKPTKGLHIALIISNTNLSFAKKAREITGVGTIRTDYRKGRKPIHRWNVQSNFIARKILVQILPYLIIKKELAELAIAYATSRIKTVRESRSGWWVPLTKEELELIKRIESLKPKRKKF